MGRVAEKIKKTLKPVMPPSATTFFQVSRQMLDEIMGTNRDMGQELEKIRNELQKTRKELEAIRRELRQGALGNYSFGHEEQNYAYVSSLPAEKYPEELCKWYYQRTGNYLDLANPRSFNEKIQWLKLYDATPLKTRLADKYLMRDWIREKIGGEYLVPLLGVWDSFDGIDFDQLPDQFVLKANHGSGWNIIVKDKSQLDREEAMRKFDKWLRQNFAYNGFQLHYLNIPPRIIAEQYVENTEGIRDYKFFCFNGKPAQVWANIFSGTPDHLRSVFDMEWNPVPLKCNWPEGGDLLKDKPRTFEQMKHFAELLSRDFAFVRVDFFEIEGKPYVGEMTFTPANGRGRFDPPEWDYRLGDLLILPEKQPMPERII